MNSPGSEPVETEEEAFPDDWTAKFEALYKYSEWQINTSIDRFQRIEKKSASYLTFIGFFIVLITYIVKYEIEHLPTTFDTIDFLIYTLLIVIILSIFASGGSLLMSLKLTKVNYPSNEGDVVDYYTDNHYLSILQGSADTFIQTATRNYDLVEVKTRFIRFAYSGLLVSVVLIPILLLFMLFQQAIHSDYDSREQKVQDIVIIQSNQVK